VTKLSLAERSLAELETVIERGLETFVEVGLALLEVRERRLYKQDYSDFDTYCRERWGWSKWRAGQLIPAAEVVTMVTEKGLPAPKNERQARELVPLKDDEAAVVDAWREAQEQSGGALTPQIIRNAVDKRLNRIKREREAEQRRAEPLEPVSIVREVEIRYGDFRDVLSDLEPNSVDAIITDPPYPGEFVPLFGELSAFASKVLTPSGVLVVMCGQYFLPQYIEELSRSMRYRWCGAYVAQGPRTRVHAAKVGTGWKPILIYQRDDAGKQHFILDDLFDSAGDDKRFHHWGQSESGFSVLVERLTQPGQLVVDPFLGGGTTALVCRDLNRRFIGCDTDAAAISTARERVA